MPRPAAERPVFVRILAVVRRIPRGRVATYGQVARLAGLPRHARHVGWALHALPHGSPLPWHRVVNARGAISLRGFDGAEVTQRIRLEKEGVRFDARGRAPLDRFGWKPGRRSTHPGRSGSIGRPCSKPSPSHSSSTRSPRTSEPETSRR